MEYLIDKSISIGIIVGVALFFNFLGKSLLRRLLKRKSKNNENRQLVTVFILIYSLWKYLIILLAATAILNVFGLGVTANSLLAAAGVGGVALGIGAQDFIKDIVNGFTIIIENQFGVGDFVQIGELQGTVINMTLRTTHLKGFGNEVYIIPNSSITQVTNYYKDNPNIIIDLYIANERDVENALKSLNEMCENFKNPYMISKPSVMGVTEITYYGAKISVNCVAKVTHFYDVQYQLFRESIDYLNKSGVKFFKDFIVNNEEK